MGHSASQCGNFKIIYHDRIVLTFSLGACYELWENILVEAEKP